MSIEEPMTDLLSSPVSWCVVVGTDPVLRQFIVNASKKHLRKIHSVQTPYVGLVYTQKDVVYRTCRSVYSCSDRSDGKAE